MALKRILTLLLLMALCLSVPRPVAATAIANSTISFSNLTIVPATGLLTLDGVWLLDAFASANNSLGESDAQFNLAFSPDTTSATASVTWATASGTATALGDPPDLNVSGSASSSVNIPGAGSDVAFSTGFGELFNNFTLSGSGIVDVQFGIDIAGMLKVLTDAFGLLATTETIFILQVDGNPVLLYDPPPLLIGSNGFQAQNFATRLTNTIPLDTGVSHTLALRADSESQAETRAVPEPASNVLLLVGLGALLWGSQRRTRARCGGR
jgi:hypothetical protein